MKEVGRLKVTAVGMINGNELEVEAQKIENKWILNNPVLQMQFDALQDEGLPIGGTYYPEKGSILAVHNILENHFFDAVISIECDDELEKIPYEENVIY